MANAQVLDFPLSTVTVLQWCDGELKQTQDCLAEETPVALIYNGVSHAVMLATAQDLEDFALGFSLSEGIVHNASELYGIEVQVQSNGIELHCNIASERFAQLKQRRRTLAGKTGCGLCGAENLAQAMRYPEPLVVQNKVEVRSIIKGLRAIQSWQSLQQKTGATHACAYVLADGTVSIVREDVGRHNALDKLVGALAKIKREAGFVVTTSRASFEMVQKTASAGIGLLVAVSAPTGLAVRVAEQSGLTLVGFARDNRHVVYSNSERILYQ
ncbi:MAG: formate dehydrogenase accessory sulfurtransferase FdhD [Methylotenera sp.]|nr:formate dehydrogenase accessory sulfurtransferase FdhD [Methylotenera sp.]MDP1755078.1 formate dehydrogenase accessory sulfurtransferase FdhD [Methylotenera sp.]MDP1960123.1 formate dehydrogenase accessory sulfurtransferase FdhD [Methylotenera sp.]MDP3207291.1 formate dehydrogenase accessory sulfurtransferase FdhD [Methylotenera sp.]MDP3303643.1 formate dehydrogenase accessory sulfurtransferase FdhD [Methylotenera sp.]